MFAVQFPDELSDKLLTSPLVRSRNLICHKHIKQKQLSTFESFAQFSRQISVQRLRMVFILI